MALDSSVSSIRAAHLHRAEQYIRDNLKDPDLGPAQVAGACGISLRYLQRLFAEREQSINGFIRDKRLNRCAEELRGGSRAASVAEIAYRWGFSDQSRFSRLYKSQFGCTPTETRHAAAARPSGVQRPSALFLLRHLAIRHRAALAATAPAKSPGIRHRSPRRSVRGGTGVERR